MLKKFSVNKNLLLKMSSSKLIKNIQRKLSLYKIHKIFLINHQVAPSHLMGGTVGRIAVNLTWYICPFFYVLDTPNLETGVKNVHICKNSEK